MIIIRRQVIAVATAHINLKVEDNQSVRDKSMMEMPQMLWKGCQANKTSRSIPSMS